MIHIGANKIKMNEEISIASAIANAVECGRFRQFCANFNLLDLGWISFNCTPHSSHRLFDPCIFDIPKYSSFISYEVDEV